MSAVLPKWRHWFQFILWNSWHFHSISIVSVNFYEKDALGSSSLNCLEWEVVSGECDSAASVWCLALREEGALEASSNVLSTSQQCSTLSLFDYRLVDQARTSASLIKVTELTPGRRESRTSTVFTVIWEGWGFTFWLCGMVVTKGAGCRAGHEREQEQWVWRLWS